MVEEWKPIENFEDSYEVSNFGRIRSLTRTIRYWNKKANKIVEKNIKGKILSPRKNNRGYYDINLKQHGTKTYRTIHRLVAEAFLEKDESRNEVNHINGIKTDNRAENLEWCTRIENERHAWKMALKRPNYEVLRNNAKNSRKRVQLLDENNKVIKTYESILKASKELDIPMRDIVKVCKGKYKSTRNKIFRYEKI